MGLRPEDLINLTLRADQVNEVLAALGEMKYIRAKPVIDVILEQIDGGAQNREFRGTDSSDE